MDRQVSGAAIGLTLNRVLAKFNRSLYEACFLFLAFCFNLFWSGVAAQFGERC
jgi:hypothetical protein